MKKAVLILAFSAIFFNCAQAQKYFGKSYPSTQHVDEYYESSDVKKVYTVMGKTELNKGFRSLEKTQQKIIALAKEKGADGIIFSMEEEVYGTTNSTSGTSYDKKNNKTTATSSSSTVDLKEKKIKATFIKYS